MSDQAHMISLLGVLHAFGGRPVLEKDLILRANIRLSEPMDSQEAGDALEAMRAQGWADQQLNDFRQRTWFITDDGRAVLRRSAS